MKVYLVNELLDTKGRTPVTIVDVFSTKERAKEFFTILVDVYKNNPIIDTSEDSIIQDTDNIFECCDYRYYLKIELQEEEVR